MEINKQKITDLIEEFKQKRDSVTIKPENLTKFETVALGPEFLSYMNGKGGYYAKFLNFLIARLRPATIVELGNREAVSTVSIFDAIQSYQAEFYTIDIEQDQRFCPEHMYTDPKVHFLFGDVASYEIVKQLPRKIDLLFSDTIHYNFQIQDEFEIYQHLLADKALVAIDDIHLNDKGVFFDAIKFDKWDLTELCHMSGWGLFLFERKQPIDVATQEQNLTRSIMKVWEKKYGKVYAELSKPTFSQKLKESIKKIGFIYKAKLAVGKILKK
ncbi:class I SAM-dependent methyltransferase [Arenimonas sp.]|nr:class I SAM-dependent methyltransferase [Candidatus Parcubacteria bacterium]